VAAGEFDDILDAKAERTSRRVSVPVDADDEFDDVLNARAERQHRYISTLIEAAVKDNPGAAAERDRLSRSTGLPPDVVARNQQELKRKEMVRAIDLDLNRMMRDSPILYRHFADPSFASMAIDDVGPLTRLGRTILSVPADITAQGLGLPELALKAGGEFLDWGAGNQPHANPLRDAGEWLGTIRQGQQALAEELRGDQSGAGFFEQGVLGGVSSFVQMLPGMLGTIATGNPAFALWAAGLQSGSTTAADAMDSGLPAWRSGLVGMTDGMIEAITEMAPAFKFVESMKVGDSFARFFGKQLMTELPGELLATLGQEYNAWAAGLRGDADLGEWVRTLPEAQAQTVIATLTMVALTSGLGRGAVRLLQDRKAAEEAPQKAERLRELFELSSASALRQRAPETFAEFVDQAAADGQQTLYLDAEALAQSVRQMPPEELERALPGAAEQLARGERWVSVPLGAAMAGVPGTALEDLIVQHSKLDPEGLTLTEASAATEQADSLIATEIDRIQQEATDQAVVIEQIDRVRGVIEEQIVASGRHSPDVAAVQAEWLARAYTVLADAEGMTPDQLWAERPLIIRAQQGMAASNGVNAGDKLTQNTGPFGQVFTEYRGDAQGAIARLTQEQSGDATAALSHPEIGDIDLVWGKAGTNRHDGYGLAKLVRWHPEVLSDLQGLIGSMRVTQRSENRVHLESEDHEASVRLQWDGQSKHWLLTAYQKRGSDTGTRTDIAGADVADDSPPTASEAIVEQDMQQFYQAQAAFDGPELGNTPVGDLIEIEKAYGGRAAWERAKADERTKLTYGQWVTVRTPAFKNWFGDWEALRSRDALQKMEDIAIQALPSDLAGASLRDEARRVYAAAAKAGPVTTLDGRKVELTPVGLKKTRFHSADRRVLDLLGSIREVLGSAQHVASVAHEQAKPGDSIRAWHYYGAKVNIGGQELFAKLVVRESVDGQIYYDNGLSGLEEISGRAGDATQTKPGAAAVSADKHTLADLLAGGNSDTVSKVIDPETGEPRAVYHGTGADIEIFQPGLNRLGAVSALGEDADHRMFFTPRADLAGQYANKNNGAVYSVFLKITNPMPDEIRSGGNRRGESGYNRNAMFPGGFSGTADQIETALRGGFDGEMVGDELRVFHPAQIKSTFNRGTFDPNDPDVRFSFVGQRAATADAHALATAQERLDAGEDAESVRRDTGWFKGEDGKWRFEINDKDAKLIGLRDDGDGKAHRNSDLGEVLDHPALFAAYPALRNVWVQIEVDQSFLDESGAYTLARPADENTVARAAQIDVKARTESEALSVLLHEVQHDIQTIEGFAKGGSASDQSLPTFLEMGKAINEDATRRQEEVRNSPEYAEFVRNFIEGYEGPQYVDRRGRQVDAAQLAADEAAYQRFIAPIEEDRLQRIDGLGDSYGIDTRYAAYRLLAGEVEARNTQSRRGLTDEQRRTTPPSTTADAASRDVIVIFNGKVAHSAPPPVNAAQSVDNGASQGDGNAQRGRRTYDNGIPQGLPAKRTADSDALERIIDAEQRRAGLPEGFQAVAVRQDQLPDALRGALAGLERATGTRVVIFRALTPEIADFNGVTIRDGVLYVSETAQSPATSTAAHEWVHNLRKTNPDLYARLENEVRRQGDAYGFAAKYGYTMGQAHEELTAAAVGDALTDPKFLERLAEHDAGLFTKMARAFLKFLKGFADGWRNQGSDAFLQDVHAFHDVLEEVLHAYERAKPKERAQAGFVKSVFARFQRVWHGTPHRGIETTGFKLNKIGSGEGAQAYGWGMYFASQREVAQRYQPRNKRAEELMMAEYSKAERAGDYESLELWEAALTHKLSDDILSEEEFGHIPITKRDAVARKVREIGKKTSAGGSLYSANIPENDELLDWDKPLSEQPEKVRQALIRADVMDESVLGEYTGQQLYEGMVRDRTMFDGMSRSDSAKAASEHLQSLGIPGLRYLDGNSRGQGEGSHNYVIWDEALLTPENADIQALYQRGKVVRAAFNPSEFAITLGPDTNLTSLHHESAHAFLELLHYLAARDGASERSRGMMDAALKWMGIAGDTPEERLAAWGAMSLNEKRAGHEQFAEGYEAYLFEGKAPTPELQRLMGRFRAWMKQAYGSLKQFFAGKGWQLDPEIRAVYDRILATDAEIRSAEERAGLVPDDAATTAAIEKLTAQSLRDLRWAREARNKTLRALQREAASKRKAVREEVAAEVMASPLEQVRKILRTTKEEDVNTPALMDALGVSSPEELARVLTLAPSAAEMIEAGTDRRMLERYGELTDPEALAAAADAAVHNEARARALAAELRAQDEVMGERADTGRRNARGARITENVVLEAGKRFADSIVRSTPVGELKAKRQLYLAAERKAARAQRAATAAGKTADAIAAQKDQLLNHLVAKGLMDAVDEADAAREEFKEYVKAGMKAQVTKGRDPAIVSMLRVIMGQYGIIERQAEKARDYLQMVQAFDPITSQRLEAIIAQAEQNAKPYKALTVDELQALRDLLGSIWEIAKTSRMMEVDGKQMRREDAAKMLLARMEEKGIPKVIPGEYGAITPGEERVLGLKGAMAWLVRVEQWTQAMDGKWGGPFTRLIFQPIKEAADRYRADRVVYLKKYEALIKQIEPYLHADPIVAHELGGYTFSGHTALLHALLHTGNESNKRKLLLGRQWASLREDGTMDTSKWDAFLQRMHDSGVITKAHWDFVQGVWDLLEETKPLAQATHRRVFGRFFDEVAADPVTTPFGTYRGGYVPAQADARQTPDAAVRALVEDQNASMINAFPEPARGFTKGRVEYNAPLLLDLGALRQHIDKVLLFAHMEGPVTDVTKLLTDKEVSNALFRISPHAYDTILLPWLKTASRQTVETPIAGDRGVHRLVTWMRSRSGMALMFANVSNTLQQVTGFVTALNKVKASSLRRAAARYIAHPADMTEVIKAKSIFMRNRIESEVSAINASMEKILINAGVFARAEMWTQEHAYFMQSAVDNVMGPIVWSAAYDEASARGESEKDAIRWADSVIRTTQGSQLPEDVARFETGNPWARLFSQFAGYFGMLANTSASELVNIHEQGLGLVRGAGKALMIGLYGVALPVWIAEAIAIAMRGGPEDDDDDGYLDDWMAAVFGWGSIRGATAMIPYAGQAVLGIATRLNDNPVDDKLSLSPAISLIESTVGVPANVYRAIIGKGTWAAAARSAAGGATLLTGLPIYAVARPISYTLGMAEGRIEPQGPWDATRGLITGTPSPESKQRP